MSANVIYTTISTVRAYCVWSVTFFSGGLFCSPTTSFLLWDIVVALCLPLNMSPSSSSSSKRSRAFLDLGFSPPSEQNTVFKWESHMNLNWNNDGLIFTYLPELDFFKLLLPRKSTSSSSSSSNSPPPPPAPPTPVGTCLETGVPFSLLSKESKSFPELNRLLSMGRKWLNLVGIHRSLRYDNEEC